MSDGLLSGAQELLCEAAAEEDADVHLVTEAYDVILKRVRDLSADGWYLNGSELLGHILELDERATKALWGAVVKLDGRYAKCTDAEIVDRLGPGEVSSYEGKRWFLGQVFVDLRDRLLEIRRLQGEAGVIVHRDEDGGAGFTTIPTGRT